MPSQHIGTFLSQKEVQMIEETCKKTGITKYRLFKDALHEFCESKLKEETKHDGEIDSGKPERRGPERDSESRGDTKTDNQRGNQAGPTPTAEHGSDLEEYLRYLRATA
jgi:hypothetical protein